MSKIINPFAGCDVYFSCSMRGVKEPDPLFPWELVCYMRDGGARVLTEHAGARTPEEAEEMHLREMGITPKEWALASKRDRERAIRRYDVQGVDASTHIVSVVNGPSHGVGMELERGILKPARGLPLTPILALVQRNIFEAGTLSSMVSGVDPEGDCEMFYLLPYSSLLGAKRIVYRFLMGKYNLPF